jgi:hypothetical protein
LTPLVLALSIAAEIPAGQLLEARLVSPVSSNRSKAGQCVEAVLINPLLFDGRIVVPAGSIVYGSVTKAAAAGLGFRRGRAALALRFDTISFGSTRIAIDSRVVQVDGARERVDELGQVEGVSPAVSVSTALGSYAWRLVFLEPLTGSIVWGVKLAFAPAPDPEIHYPAGTELLIELVTKTPVSEAEPSLETPLSAPTEAAVREFLVGSAPLRVRKRNGEWGDRINFVATGERAGLERAFAAAGWSLAEPRSARTVAKTYYSIVQQRGYATAPMSPFTFAGAEPELRYQKVLNTFAKRHHIRLWRTAATIDGAPVWVGAATDDIGIEFSKQSKRWTHQIDPEIDNERMKVLSDLLFTGCVDSSGLVAGPGLETPHLQTDGAVAVARLSQCESPRAMPSGEPQRRPGFFGQIQRLGVDLWRTNPVTIAASALHVTPRAFSSRQRPANYRARWARQRMTSPSVQ